MPIDPACQPIADTIATLESDRDTIRAGLATLRPLDRWKALVQIGDLSRQIADQQVQLDNCQRQHAASYSADVVIFDTTGGPLASRQASLWQIEGTSATLMEQKPLSNAGLSFTTPPPTGPVGITIAETGNPAVQGVDFRSAPLEELPRKSASDPSGRIEIVLGPVLTFGVEEVEGWLSALVLPAHTSSPLNNPLFSGSVDIAWATVGVTLAAGRIQLSASGTVTITGSLIGTQSAPFSIDVPLRFGLPLTPGVDVGCNVRMAGTPNLTVGGQLGAIVNPLAPLFFDFVGGAALNVLRERVNEVLPRATAALFGLDDLSKVPRLSLRRFEITPTAVTIQPTLGGFGDVLSTFIP
jgi:hypothetical protein